MTVVDFVHGLLNALRDELKALISAPAAAIDAHVADHPDLYVDRMPAAEAAITAMQARLDALEARFAGMDAPAP